MNRPTKTPEKTKSPSTKIRAAEAANTFWEHAASLRLHLLISGVFFVIAASAAFPYADLIIAYLLRPLAGTPLVFLSPLEPFLFKIQISLYAGCVLAVPVWLGLVLHFVFPALKFRQRVATVLFVVVSVVFSLLSFTLTYLYAVPFTLKFLFNFVVPGTSFLLTPGSYLSFILLQTIVVFMILELPLVIIVLAYVGLVNPYTLARQRRFFYPGLFALLAIATPTTDAVTLAIIAIPTILLSEAGLSVAKAIYSKKQNNHDLITK